MNDSGCKKKFKVDEYIKYCKDLLKQDQNSTNNNNNVKNNNSNSLISPVDGDISKKLKQRKITDSIKAETKK